MDGLRSGLTNPPNKETKGSFQRICSVVVAFCSSLWMLLLFWEQVMHVYSEPCQFRIHGSKAETLCNACSLTWLLVIGLEFSPLIYSVVLNNVLNLPLKPAGVPVDNSKPQQTMSQTFLNGFDPSTNSRLWNNWKSWSKANMRGVIAGFYSFCRQSVSSLWPPRQSLKWPGAKHQIRLTIKINKEDPIWVKTSQRCTTWDETSSAKVSVATTVLVNV